MTDVEMLRKLINEPTEDTYTDIELASRISVYGGINAAASVIWREKAAAVAQLVDMREGTSDRKLSQLHDTALKMANEFAAAAERASADALRRTTVREITR